MGSRTQLEQSYGDTVHVQVRCTGCLGTSLMFFLAGLNSLQFYLLFCRRGYALHAGPRAVRVVCTRNVAAIMQQFITSSFSFFFSFHLKYFNLTFLRSILSSSVSCLYSCTQRLSS